MTMKLQSRARLFAIVAVSLTACRAPSSDESNTLAEPIESAASSDAGAPARIAGRFYEGYGGYARTITTTNSEAQRYFDQGIQLLYGFNHDEAIRSFRSAAQLDPECAMAWWGIAYANGLDINNAVVSEEEARIAFEAAQEAQRHLEGLSPEEAALVRAVAERYSWPNPEDRRELDEAYSLAMEEAWLTFPDDADIGAFYAESLMNLQPWDLWEHDGTPKGKTLEIVEVLERVMELHPDHPGANHFYIHTVEASGDADRAVAAADRLVALVPGAGHLVHMPSHIYTRVGRYADAADANVRAIEADKAYFEVAPAPDFYSLYFIHNVHFLAYAAMMEGRYDVAMEAARELETEVPGDFLTNYVQFADGLMTTALHVMIRFGKWEEILDEPEPAEFRKLSRAMRNYARGVAFSALGRTDEARAELAAFEETAVQVPSDWKVGNNSSADVLALARQMILGELLYREGKLDEGFAALYEGVRLEDDLVYDEPPGWMQPIRHALGALLMSADRYAEAETVYRRDLGKNRANGWSLLGLEQALAAQGDARGASVVRKSREAAWVRADVAPTSSCYCEPGE